MTDEIELALAANTPVCYDLGQALILLSHEAGKVLAKGDRECLGCCEATTWTHGVEEPRQFAKPLFQPGRQLRWSCSQRWALVLVPDRGPVCAEHLRSRIGFVLQRLMERVEHGGD